MNGAIVLSMAVDWGSVPDWLAGTGTILAVAFAATAAKAAWKANQIQARQLERLEQSDSIRMTNEDRAQAQRVAVWLRMSDTPTPSIVCFNGSDLPVYGLRIHFALQGKKMVESQAYYAVKGPDSAPRVLGYATKQIMSTVMREAENCDRELDWTSVYQNNAFDLTVQFRDSGGRTWTRLGDGELIRVEDDPRSIP